MTRDELLQVIRTVRDGLAEMTSAEFALGGDRELREMLDAALADETKRPTVRS